MNHPKHRPGLCPCKRAQKRPNQGNCAACHALANRAYRRRQKLRLEQAHELARRVLMRGYAGQGVER